MAKKRKKKSSKMLIAGAPLVHVRAYVRHRRRHAVHGAVPSALSVTHRAPTPHEAKRIRRGR